MVQLIAESKAFHFVISKRKFGVQGMISYNSLHEILILNTPRRENESRRGRNREIQGLSFLTNLIFSKHLRMKFFVKEYVNL